MKSTNIWLKMKNLFANEEVKRLNKVTILALCALAICMYTQHSVARTLPHVIEHQKQAPAELQDKSQIKRAEQELQRSQDANEKARQQNQYYKYNEPQTIQHWQSEIDLLNTQQSIRNAEGDLYSSQRRAQSQLQDRKLTEQNLDTQQRRQNSILRSYPRQYHGRR